MAPPCSTSIDRVAPCRDLRTHGSFLRRFLSKTTSLDSSYYVNKPAPFKFTLLSSRLDVRVTFRHAYMTSAIRTILKSVSVYELQLTYHAISMVVKKGFAGA
jgi:hypothetical protein